MNDFFENVREARFAGSFYPQDANELKRDILEYVGEGKKLTKSIPRIIIVPHAGYFFSGKVAGKVYKQTEGYNYKNIYILGSAHTQYVKNIGLCTCPSWWTPLGVASGNVGKINELSKSSGFSIKNEAFVDEHSIEVKLPFVSILHPKSKIIPMLSSDLEDAEGVVSTLIETIKNDGLLVISTDLSHYYPSKIAQKIDQNTINKILNLESNFTEEAACGLVGIEIAILIAKANKLKPILVEYKHSGMITGEMGGVVGYVGIVFK